MASECNGGQASSVEEAVKKMTCDELIEALKKVIPDERYKADLKILEEESIDGELFLDLPDDPDLKEVFDKLRGGGKAKIKKVVRGIKDGSLKFGQADCSRKLVEPDMPWCTTQTPDDAQNGSDNGTTADDGDMQRAWMPLNAMWPGWKNYQEIYVEFRNVGLLANWRIGDGQPMNTDTVLRYANTWSRMGGGKIPRFVEVENGRQAQIRVSFNNGKVRNSYLGKRAQSVPTNDPTMNLDLHNGCPSDEYKKHLIIHEFGHALGLGHEHQRSIFWRCIKPFTNIVKMKQDLNVNDKQFAKDWKEIVDSEAGHHTPDYDPNSIMHYWFKVEWLTHGYSDKTKVERDRDMGILSKKSAEAILGIHKRRHILADKPSPKDIQLLQEVYGGGRGAQSDGTIEQDYDAAGGPIPRTGEKKRVTADGGVSADGETEPEKASVAVSAKRQKVIEFKEPVEDSEPVIEEEYDFEVTNAWLSRMVWSEDNEEKVVSIYEESKNSWRQIGENLGLADYVLDGFEDDCRNVRSRVTKVLGKWQENACGLPHGKQYPKTWRGLINLLKHSGLSTLAGKVEKALMYKKSRNGRVMASGPPVPVNGQNGGQGSSLTLKNLDKVNSAVRGARSQWYPIGLALEIDPDDLDTIRDVNRGHPDGSLMDVLKKFLRQVDPKPSWKRLADAMASPSVGRGDIAEELREKYC